MSGERSWKSLHRITRAQRGAETSTQTQETRTPRGDALPVGLVGLTVADVPRLLRGLALLATGVETVLLPRSTAGDTTVPRPAVADTVSGEDTTTLRPDARAPGRLPGRAAALQDRLSVLSAPLTPGMVAATTKARQARDAARQTVTTMREQVAAAPAVQLVQTSGRARRMILAGLLGGGVVTLLVSPLGARARAGVRRAWGGDGEQGTMGFIQTARQGAARAAGRARQVLMNRTQAPARLLGYDVLDASGAKIGQVDNVWVDDATQQLEFLGVQTSWLEVGKDHLIPAATASVDTGQHTIQVPYPADQVKDAPSYAADAQLSAADEDSVYTYYGINRSTAPSPTGLAGAIGATGPATTSGTGYARTDSTGGDVRVPLTEEQLQVGTRQGEAGRAHLRKIVRTEQVSAPVELRREEVHVERVPVSGAAVSGELPDDAFQEKDIEVTVMQEEPVVSKQARVTGEVHVGKTPATETRTVEGEVRKEDVVVDRDDDTRGARS
jgi:uncharacterized protein (TIGR02271 family)